MSPLYFSYVRVFRFSLLSVYLNVDIPPDLLIALLSQKCKDIDTTRDPHMRFLFGFESINISIPGSILDQAGTVSCPVQRRIVHDNDFTIRSEVEICENMA
jgi:hypothetical protein